MAKTPAPFATHARGMKDIPVDELFPNPHNPRILFDKLPMSTLKASIKKSGILVPLTVYHDEKKDRYVILDGQRRWMCAKEVGLITVPANIVPQPSLVQNIVTMFQIHKLREDWELMPTALKVQLLMEETGDKNDANLAELTGLDEAVITRCKKLISFDGKFQDMMLDPDPDKRVKADFFIELYPVIHDRDVKLMPWFAPKRFTEQMLVKYQEEPRTIKSVTDFRLLKQHVTNARRIKVLPKLSTRLKRFAEEPDVLLETLEIEEASTHAEAKALVRKIDSIEATVAELDVEQFYGEEELWKAMARLIKAMEQKLRSADKRR